MLNSRHFKSIYKEYLESGLTVRLYCANHQISESKFYYWQNKLRKELPQSNGFVPLIIDNDNGNISSQVRIPANGHCKTFPNVPETDRLLSCEISYPNGVSLKLSGIPDAGLLQSLLLLLQR